MNSSISFMPYKAYQKLNNIMLNNLENICEENKGYTDMNEMQQMNKNVCHLPFYPSYRYECSLDNTLNIFWFEKNFCQQQFGPLNRRNGHACTLIVLMMANKCVEQRILKVVRQRRMRLSHEVIMLLANSILEGNEIYFQTIDNNSYLSIPEALRILGTTNNKNHIVEWKSFIYSVNMKMNLYAILKDVKHQWLYKSSAPDKSWLFMVLISEGRSILLIYSTEQSMRVMPVGSHCNTTDNTITLIDSHCHRGDGAVIVQCDETDVRSLSVWIYNRLFNQIYLTNPNCFELTLFEIQSDSDAIES